jgi:hypothetical protein
MVKDIFDSFKDSVKERTTNPFLGTLIIVWILKNWKLVYSLFYFDSRFTLAERLLYIDTYFKQSSFLLNVLYAICITIGVLITTYLLLGLSRLIGNLYHKLLIPWVYYITDKGSIVEKSEYNILLERIKVLDERVEVERLAKVSAQNERDLSDQKLSTMINDRQSVQQSTFTFEEEDLYNKALASSTWQRMSDIIIDVRRGMRIDHNDPTISLLLKHNLIKPTTVGGSNAKVYKFTEEGDKFVLWFNNIVPEGSTEEVLL